MKIANLSELLALPNLAHDLAEVEREMLRAVGPAHPSLALPARRMISGKGKRLRPTLVLAAAALGQPGAAVPAAAAVELVHIGTLVHDDIIDHSTTRWGAPTVVAQEGSTSALLVGDYLLALAGVLAAEAGADAGRLIAQTVAQLCAGQSQEQADAFNASRGVAGYLESIGGKTAALLSAACRLGGLCGGLPAAQVEALAAYGEAFGLAFQLTDDLLDLTAPAAAVGKPAGHDLSEGVYTLPLLLALEGPAGPKLRAQLGNVPAIPPDYAKILTTIREAGAIDATLGRIRHYNATAVAALAIFAPTPTLAGLAAFPQRYLEWALAKLPAI